MEKQYGHDCDLDDLLANAIAVSVPSYLTTYPTTSTSRVPAYQVVQRINSCRGYLVCVRQVLNSMSRFDA